MNTTALSRNNATRQTTRGMRAMSVAGALACLALAPTTIASAAQVSAQGGSASSSSTSSTDIDDVVYERTQQIARDSVKLTMSVGHCGHHALHQPRAASGLPVSDWYTPTSC